ncbi:hypothetical protein GGS23DRAFT_552540 [Durotheca rogersii]|uniref:uncharacterized protein n=1 Tax=Durotheca rogersii TaxID=419775 RepID=UPI00221E3853|nr:uncharacterized protein GGS23DRAFT_552540 [Durotheca rogersii]KAI5866882.1 hypothetical protein GGS23DRAFT_552540 [Durotheca rogersii]
MPPADAPATPSGKVPLNGCFLNGVWHCNCIPRLPAVSLQAKKESANKGRSFYTCQKDRNKKNKCGFFLWAEDARRREMGSLMSNSRTETNGPGHKRQRQRTLHESITPSKEKRPWYEKTPVTSIADLSRALSATAASPAAGAETTSLKRKRDDFDDDNDDYGNFSSGEEEFLATLADSSSKPPTVAASLVSGGGEPRGAFATPAAARTHVVASDGMPTPLTKKPVRRVLFVDEAAAAGAAKLPKPAGDSFSSAASSPPAPATTTPTPKSGLTHDILAPHAVRAHEGVSGQLSCRGGQGRESMRTMPTAVYPSVS